MRVRTPWLTYVVLGVGIALRIGLALVTPPERAYDNHYEPVHIILIEGRLPSAADCWECYQPPLYYVLSAGLCRVAQPVAAALIHPAPAPEHVARRTLQFVSAAAGCATLWVCLLILRTQTKLASHEALALSLVAVLPQHIYMSAMATNDALTYLLASLAIYAALRAHAGGWPARGCVVTGLLAGTAVLCKGYGWVTLAAIGLAVWLFTRKPTAQSPAARRRCLAQPVTLVLLPALALGIWPTLRNVWIYDTPLVDNFKLFPETPMQYQPPGSLLQTDFVTFRLAALLRRPWVHMAHVDSFWTQLYARLWFDYEGFNTTLAPYPPWQRLWERCAARYPQWNSARWRMLLEYRPDDVPVGLARAAAASYVAGLVPTGCVLVGLVLALRRSRCDFACALLAAHFLLALAVPLFQTLRLPHFAAMKATFALSGLSSIPPLAGLLLSSIRARLPQRLVSGTLWLTVAVICLADVAYVFLSIPAGS